MMRSDKAKAVETARFLKKYVHYNPEIAILTGTGLDGSAKDLDIRSSFHYGDIPHFPVSTVEGHPGRLHFGMLKGAHVVFFQGRCHLYEGYSPLEVTFPVRVMKELGIQVLILSNAAGGLNPDFEPGDIMVIQDHINLTCANPLTGPNEESWGVRFPDMTHAYDPRLRYLAETMGKNIRTRLQKGVYVGLKGPSLETPAEVRFLKTIGADAVGFSTVQEVIAAVHSGIKVLGLSVITNLHDVDKPVPSGVDDMIAVARQAADCLALLVEAVIQNIRYGL